MTIGFFDIEGDEESNLRRKLTGHTLSFTSDSLTSQTPNLGSFEIISTRTQSKIDYSLLNNLPNLKLITTRTTGFDHIDVKVAHEKNITVCNVPAYGEVTVAEYTFALLLSLSRKTYSAIKQVKDVQEFGTEGLRGFDLFGKTLGVVGTGHIGVHVIKIARGFGMNIQAYDAYPNQNLQQDLGFKYVSLEELLSISDIITLHVPYLPTTHHLINLQNISKINKGAYLLNTSRGAVIETEALIYALQNQIISGAALDVLENEEQLHANDQSDKITALNKRLISLDNVLISPHNAFNTIEAEQRIEETTISNIQNFLNNQPKNIVK